MDFSPLKPWLFYACITWNMLFLSTLTILSNLEIVRNYTESYSFKLNFTTRISAFILLVWFIHYIIRSNFKSHFSKWLIIIFSYFLVITDMFFNTKNITCECIKDYFDDYMKILSMIMCISILLVMANYIGNKCNFYQLRWYKFIIIVIICDSISLLLQEYLFYLYDINILDNCTIIWFFYKSIQTLLSFQSMVTYNHILKVKDILEFRDDSNHKKDDDNVSIESYLLSINIQKYTFLNLFLINSVLLLPSIWLFWTQSLIR